VSPDSRPYSITASIKDYLLGLQESGVDGIPGEGRDSGLVTRERSASFEPIEASPAVAPIVQVTAVSQQDKTVYTRHESLDKTRKDLGDCQLCQLGRSRKKLVFGVGNPQARIVFVGEWPGVDEDQQGEPFVGEAGQVLNRIITAMGLKRDEIYICNVVKCCPPDKRDPHQEEIESCLPFLLKQIQSIKPEVVVTLGKFSTQILLGLNDPITRLRGKFHDYHGVPLMPTYHPSYLSSNKGDAGLFWDVWEAMVQVLQLLKLPVPEKSSKR